METKSLPISKDALLDVIEVAKLDSKQFPTCEYYASQIGCIEFDVERMKNAANFLTRFCAMRLSSTESNSQFFLPGTTWTEVEYSDDQLDILGETVGDIANPELRARAYDVLWLRKRNIDDAKKSAIAYIDAAEICIAAESPTCGERFGRGMSLAVMINDHELVEKLGKRVESSLSSTETNDFLIAESIDELLCKRVFDPNILLAFCHTRIASTNNSLAKQRFCTLARRCAIRANKKEDAEQAILDLAASYEGDADASQINVVKISHLRQSIQTLRQLRGTESQRQRVHQKMLQVQQELEHDFKPSKVGSVDIANNVANAKSRIRGKSKTTGIAELVMASQFNDESKAKENAIESIRSFPLQNMFAVEKFGSTYKSATAIPSAGFAEMPDERVFYSMINEYQCLFGIVAHGTILPMISELNLNHHLTFGDVAEFVYRSPAIPQGHHEYFCLGFLAGIQGRFVEALHCLVPQLELVIRFILQHENVIVSGLDQRNNQREFDLNKLLEMDETSQLLTKNVVTTLRIIFTHQAGANIRNELAHGMLPSGACESSTAIYGWWTIIWLVLHPIAERLLEIERATLLSGENSDDRSQSPS